jgi:hypothetical protein
MSFRISRAVAFLSYVPRVSDLNPDLLLTLLVNIYLCSLSPSGHISSQNGPLRPKIITKIKSVKKSWMGAYP